MPDRLPPPVETRPEDRPVTQGTFDLRLKVLEQRLTLRMVAGLVAVSALTKISIPASLTDGTTAFVGAVAGAVALLPTFAGAVSKVLLILGR